MTLYHIPQSTYAIRIVKIRYRSDSYIKAHIRFINKFTFQSMGEIRNCKIPLKNFTFWEVYENQ